MPGMDGLQAVQAIKNDPRTATIPIMMYTSQEGELYLGQARALGALGVLPKQIKPADVSKVLYQLHLVPDRRNNEQVTFTPLNARVEGVAVDPDPPGAKALTDTALREHFAELRRALVAGVDTQTDRITAEIRALLLEALPPPAPGAPPPTARTPWAWLVACLALAVALASTTLWWRSVRILETCAAGPGRSAGSVAAERCHDGAGRGARRKQGDRGAGALWRRRARWRAAGDHPPAALSPRAPEDRRRDRHQDLPGTLLPGWQRRRRLLAGTG
jgi:CheY-like chemotaxis protein